MGYPGNDLNNGTVNKQPGLKACRSSCMSISGAKYFAFNNLDESCWCKTSNSIRTQQAKMRAGNVNCIGKN